MGCLFGMWFAGHDGFSRLLSDTAKRDSVLASADEAIQLSPKDPDAHYARAFVLASMGRFVDAAREYEATIALRRGDYVLWAALGEARARAEDKQGAIAAYQEAVRLAPYYAYSHWELGRLALQSGHRDEAFAELRLATNSRPSFLAEVINLAWEAYSGDARAVQEALQPQTATARLTLAKFFIDHGNTAQAIPLVRAASDASGQERQALLAELLNTRRFAEAYEVWSSGRAAATVGDVRGDDTIVDGSFEGNVAVNDQGFGWQPARSNDVLRLSLDSVEPRSGAYSLRLEFNGDFGASPLISQLAMVEPRTRYQLTFAARTKELVTGGLPVVTVTDAGSTDGHALGQSAPLPQGTSPWQNYAVEFTTSEVTNAMQITIRQKCTGSPCPIFGIAWFDDFSLQKVGGSHAQQVNGPFKI